MTGLGLAGSVSCGLSFSITESIFLVDLIELAERLDELKRGSDCL